MTSRTSLLPRFPPTVLLLLLVLSFLPTLYGYLTCPPDRWFSGVVYNMHDTAQYLTWMREAAVSLFTDNKLTAEPTPAVFVNLHWWLPGRLAALVGMGFAPMYQLYRLVAVALLVWVNYRLAAHLFADRARRRFAFLLNLLGSGLGWIWVVLKYAGGGAAPFFPLDVYTTPGNGFWVMVASPHLALAAALVAGVLLLALRAVEQDRIGWALGAGGLALFLGLGHVYDLVTVWAVLALFGLLRVLRDGRFWRTLLLLGSVVLLSAPAPLYWAWVSSHPAWGQALAQYENLGVFTPDPLHLLVLLGLPFLLAAATFRGWVPLRAQDDRWLLVKAWFVSVPLLVYLPLHFQIMLLTGYTAPVAALATRGLFDHILPWIAARWERLARWVPVTFLVLAALTNVYLLGWRFVELSRHHYPFYLHRDEVAAMEWLERETPPDEVVLSSFVVGHFLPGIAGDRVFLGNAVMTLDFNRKREQVAAFFGDGMSDAERAELLRRYDVRYVFYGPAERSLGSYDPEQAPFLELAYRAGEVSIYSVRGQGDDE
ncbi:MAG TPA: hypothetical protein EYH27_03150 [Anaerolineales bacterium]|nr:hypothetical protein [Anaerolineae bacterium]HIP87418.1 hypothetical protein [Anaerolineales bacterium]